MIDPIVKKALEIGIRQFERVATRSVAASPDSIERMADSMLVRATELLMESKLAAAREKGRGGWWDKEVCTLDYLRGLLKEHIEKGDLVDVINLAAMVTVREIMEEIHSHNVERIKNASS